MQVCRVTSSVLFISATMLALTSTAAAQVQLKWAFPAGETWTSTSRVKTDQTLSIAGMDIITGSDQTTKVTTKVGQRAADGTLLLSQTIDAMKVTVSLPGGVELEFDSADPDAAPPGTQFDGLLDIYRAISKSSWTETLSADNRVIAVEGRDSVLDKLDETLRETISDRLQSDYLAQQANNELDKLPRDPVSPGDRWQRSNTVRLEGDQQLKFTTEFEYQGVVMEDGKPFDRINSKTLTVEYTVGPNSPLKLKASDLKIAGSDGYMLYDRERGQVVYSQGKARITGTITFLAGDQELPGELDLTLDNTAKRSS